MEERPRSNSGRPSTGRPSSGRPSSRPTSDRPSSGRPSSRPSSTSRDERPARGGRSDRAGATRQVSQGREVIDIKVFGAPGKSRTSNLQIRSLAFYPIELRALILNFYKY